MWRDVDSEALGQRVLLSICSNISKHYIAFNSIVKIIAKGHQSHVRVSCLTP